MALQLIHHWMECYRSKRSIEPHQQVDACHSCLILCQNR